MSNVLQTYNSLNPIAELSKSDLVQLSEKQIEDIIESGSAEIAFAFLHKTGTLIELVRKGIMESAINQINKGNDFAFGLKMVEAHKPTYDYSNDEKHAKMKRELSEHEAFLKKIKGRTETVDKETSEVWVHYPPFKKVSDYIKTEF